MPTQKITLEIETEAIAEEERAELSAELVRAANVVLSAKIANRDSLVGRVARWDEK